MRTPYLFLALVVLASIAASAAPAAAGVADGFATVFTTLDGGRRCYTFSGAGEASYWLETNGRMTGGERTLTGQGSGLQRTRVGTIPPDTRLANAMAWTKICSPNADPGAPPNVPEVPPLGPVPHLCDLAPATPGLCAPLDSPGACDPVPALPILCGPAPAPPCVPFPACAVPKTPAPPCSPVPQCAVPPGPCSDPEAFFFCNLPSQLLQCVQQLPECLIDPPCSPVPGCAVPPVPDRCELAPDTCCSGPLDGGSTLPCAVAQLRDAATCLAGNAAHPACLGLQPPCEPWTICLLGPGLERCLTHEFPSYCETPVIVCVPLPSCVWDEVLGCEWPLTGCLPCLFPDTGDYGCCPTTSVGCIVGSVLPPCGPSPQCYVPPSPLPCTPSPGACLIPGPRLPQCTPQPTCLVAGWPPYVVVWLSAEIAQMLDCIQTGNC